MVSNGIHDCIVLHFGSIFFRREFFGEARAYFSTFVSIDNVPHLGFAEAVVALLCQLVVRMNLDGQVAGGINYFYQQREGVSKNLIVFVAYQLTLIFVNPL